MGYWFAAYARPYAGPRGGQAQPVADHRRGQRCGQIVLRDVGLRALTTTPQELAQFQAAETQKWGQVIKAAGITPE
jgi:hypothetical protein